MDIGIISSRYAKALLRYATEQGENKAVYQCMTSLQAAFVQVKALRSTLENPVIDAEKKLRLLLLAACAEQHGCKCLEHFFKLLVKNRRVAMAGFIANSYIGLYRKQQHLVHSHLTLPVAPDAATIERIKNIVKQKTQDEVEFIVDVDPSIIGGFIMEYDTYSFDASIRARLARMKKQLMAGA